MMFVVFVNAVLFKYLMKDYEFESARAVKAEEEEEEEGKGEL